MRNLASPSAVLGLVVGMVVIEAPARADDLAGAYDVKFEQVATNCEHPVAYPLHGALKIDVKGSDMQVDIDRTPIMVGKAGKLVKISTSEPGHTPVNAKSPKPGHTPVEGMDGVFTVAGRITAGGMLSLMMIGEYQTGGKPLCTQSWNLSGLRAREKTDKPESKPDKPKK
jgi:hypothetical protein